MISTFSISTPLGNFIAEYSENGLAGMSFPNAKDAPSGETARGKISPQVRQWHRQTETALKKMLSGEKPANFPPLDLKGTEFQKSVWREMLKIPYGKTKSYGEVAKAVGKPKAVRAVGGACGANSIPVLVPCHRVLAANNKIGGFGSGLGWKCKLLEIEGVELAGARPLKPLPRFSAGRSS
ncbi:MAG TPA: methylated-DNA--[protein]-cysteine S-methyltransferase [Pseudomonadales bacterium]|nr:methylated-DNA--[protein]-cysteine S-methyltransferase [Pseudomonadales bacterium]